MNKQLYYSKTGLILMGILAFMMASLTPGYGQTNCNEDLVIVGLLDGPLGGTPKFVELYAINNIPDLSIYGIGSANNGNGTDGIEYSLPSGSLTAGSTIYIANDTANFRVFMGFGANYEDGGAACNFNGDDAFELFKNGVVIDVFGDINMDGTGTNWEYTDGWIKRVNNTGPDDSTFVQGNWAYSGINVFDNQTTNATSPTPYPLATYMANCSGGPTGPTVELILKGVISADFPMKALEFEVLANISDLSVYGIGCTNNGGGSDGLEWSFPTASANAGDRIYVARDSVEFRNFFGFDANFYDSPGAAINFNGDDGLEVYKNGQIIEIFGDTLLDGTGEAWEYTGGWAHRKDGTGPDTSGFVLANWDFAPLNSLDGITLNSSAPQPYPVLGASSPKPNLVLVGLIHGSAAVKSTEYYVLDDIPDLSVYGVGCTNNGGGTDSVEWSFPAVSASKGDRLYVTRDSAAFRDFFGFDANFIDAGGDAHNFNGDDAFELFENGVVIDVFGDIALDGTGEAWEYTDAWAQRNCATGPDSATFVLANWTIGTIGTFDTASVNSNAADPYPVDTYLPTPCGATGGGTDLVITEIMYNTPGTDLEYLEFYNNTSSAIDMTGYSISDAISFTFPSFSLNPGELVLITDDSLGMQNFWGQTAFQWSSGSLNNGGESITLKDASGVVVDSVRYDDANPWTATADGNGPSLILCDPNLDNNDGANWQRALNSSGKLFDGTEVFGNPGVLDSCVSTPIVAIQRAELTVGEGVGSITIEFYVDNPNGQTVNVGLTVLPTSTADINDFFFSNTSVTFPAGTDTVQTVEISITDDSNQEPQEFFTLLINNPFNCVISNDTMNVAIIDNDAPLTKALTLVGIAHGPNSGVPKAVELLATQNIPNLSLFGLGCANNGGGTDGQEYTFPNVSVAAGTHFFVANDTAGFRAFFGCEADFTDQGSATNFNGDDAFEVYESGRVIDIYGEVDVDGTGTAWEYSLGWVKRKMGTGPDSAFVLANWDNGGLNALQGGTTNEEATNPYVASKAECISINVDEDDLVPPVWVYPNPAKNLLHIDTKEVSDRIQILNAMGQLIMEIEQPTGKDVVNISHLPNEIYLIRGISKNGIWTRKIVVNH
ncbi:MAG: lamin tail domain-containing protein [Bacteroidia bacterium]|nr:lamin tail domain-containing protein [Bacteroidia bacterium]